MTDEELLRSRGLRATRPRLAALVALRSDGHLTADSVRARINGDGGQVSVQAVYDVLTALRSVGLVRRIEPAGSAARYEIRTGDNHHHLVCRSCGAIEDVDCVVGAAPCLRPDEGAGTGHGPDPGSYHHSGHGFDIDEAEITFWGRCPACRAAPATSNEATTRGNTRGKQ